MNSFEKGKQILSLNAYTIGKFHPPLPKPLTQTVSFVIGMYPPKKKSCRVQNPWKKYTSMVNFWDLVFILQRKDLILGGVNSNMFYFHPYLGKMNPFWLIFFRWVETTNQYILFTSFCVWSTKMQSHQGLLDFIIFPWHFWNPSQTDQSKQQHPLQHMSHIPWRIPCDEPYISLWIYHRNQICHGIL